MITSRNHQDKYIEREKIEGIDVIYIRNNYDNSFGLVKRVNSFLKFMVVSYWSAFKEKNVSLVFATSTPLTVGLPALFLKWFNKKNYIFEVRDLWPEAPIQMGVIRNKFIVKFLNYFESVVYKNAKHIIALSPGMREGVINAGVNPEKVSIIPNMSKTDRFFQREKDKNLMQRFNLHKDVFYTIHFGAMGIANDLDYLIDGFKILQYSGEEKIYLLFAGAGGMENHLKQRCKNESIRNVLFLGSFDMDDIAELVNIADCSIITFKDLPILKTNSPNKFFDSLSAQKPIIVNSNGWTKDLVENNNCGAFVNPNNPEDLANLLIEWKSNPAKLKEMGINSRMLAENKYDKKILVNKFMNLISSFISHV